jgi:hypothetical protein
MVKGSDWGKSEQTILSLRRVKILRPERRGFRTLFSSQPSVLRLLHTSSAATHHFKLVECADRARANLFRAAMNSGSPSDLSQKNLFKPLTRCPAIDGGFVIEIGSAQLE